MFPNKIQYFISNYYIFDIFPLDKTLHIIIGAILTIVLRKFGLRMKHVFAILAILCIVKELIDSKTIGSTFSESITDIVVSFFYPIIVVIIIKLKSNLNKASE